MFRLSDNPKMSARSSPKEDRLLVYHKQRRAGAATGLTEEPKLRFYQHDLLFQLAPVRRRSRGLISFGKPPLAHSHGKLSPERLWAIAGHFLSVRASVFILPIGFRPFCSPLILTCFSMSARTRPTTLLICSKLSMLFMCLALPVLPSVLTIDRPIVLLVLLA